MSYKYTWTNRYLTVVKTLPMACWYVSFAFFSPNDMRVNAYVSEYFVSVVFPWS